DQIRERRRQRARQNQLVVIGVIAVAAIGVAAWLAYQNLRPIGAIVTVPTETFPLADGKALGPAGAKALVQEFADFQCPFCGRYAANLEPLLMKDYLTAGAVR